MTKVNPAIVLLVILGLSVSIRMARDPIKGSAHSSVTQPFHSQILKPSVEPQFVPVHASTIDSGFNPVWSFFGEGLSNTDAQLYSKAGWTSIARAETATIDTGEQGTTYILAVFSGTSAYADDVQLFPKISRLVYKRMISRSSKK